MEPNKKKIKNKVIELADRYPYFHIDDLREFLTHQGVKFSSQNLKAYLNYLKKKGILHSAGRGWYSLLGDKLYLDREPVREVVSIIRDNFPGLKFSCWSTEQLKDFFLHIPFDFLTFVYVEREFMEYVRELLEERKYTVYKNPSQKEAGKFISVKERTIILRPFARIRNEMTEFASIEKILVDLYREIYRLNLMDMEEYKNILQSVARNYVINMSKFLDYAYERKMKKNLKSLLQELSIIPTRHFYKKPQR